MKKILILCVVFMIVLTSCFASPNVKEVKNVNGDKVKVLQDNEEKSVKSNLKYKYSNELDKLTTIEGGHYGFYLYDDSILILEEVVIDKYKFSDGTEPNSFNFKLIGRKGEIEDGVFEDFYFATEVYTDEEEVYDIQQMGLDISPDRRKLAYTVGKRQVSVHNLLSYPDGRLEAVRSRSERYADDIRIVPKSLGWVDNKNVMFSTDNGNIRITNIVESGKVYKQIDSFYKTHLKVIDDSVIYIKNIELQQKDKEGPNYKEIKEMKPINDLIISNKSEAVNQIIETSEDFNIKNYEVSPNDKKIAMYVEDKENNGKLYIADIDVKLSNSVNFDNLTEIADERVLDMKWSDDSTRLAYSTDTDIPGLFVVNEDSSSNNQIITNKRVVRLQWNLEGDSILGVEEKKGGNLIYAIKLK